MSRLTYSYKIDNVEVFKSKLLEWSRAYDTVIYLDSNNSKQKYTSYDAMMAIGVQQKIKCNHEGAFDVCKIFYEQTKDWIFGYFSYDLKNDIETLSSKNMDNLHFPDLFFFQPQKLICIERYYVHFLYLSHLASEVEKDFKTIKKMRFHEIQNKAKIALSPRLSKETYFKKFKRIQDYIQRGDIYEINLCVEFFGKGIIDPLSIFLKLNTLSQAPFSAFMKQEHLYAMCSSPERFLKKINSTIISQPIKGTIKRSENKNKDALLRNTLRNHSKERSENIMTVDLTRNDLSKVAKKGSVAVDRLCQLYTSPQAHQLISTVRAEITEKVHPVNIIKETFPMASMTGVPKLKAMQFIESLEVTKRGLYSGAIGYFSPNGDFDFNVVIRTLLYNHLNNYLSLTAGGAITSQSIQEDEYAEIALKIKTLQEVLS